MITFDHKTKEDMDQYMFSLNKFTTVSNPAVPKKDVSIDPLLH